MLTKKNILFLEKKIRINLTVEERKDCLKFLKKELFLNYKKKKEKKYKNAKDYLKATFGSNFNFLTLWQLKKISQSYFYEKTKKKIWQKNALTTPDGYILYKNIEKNNN